METEAELKHSQMKLNYKVKMHTQMTTKPAT